jgi:molybdate transport system permease protein
VDLAPVWLSLKLATVTTVVLLVAGTPVAWWLAHTRSRSKPLVEATVALPLVLPPTVLGFYLLTALGPAGMLGSLWSAIGGAPLVFTFTGLVIGSVIFSLPFAIQPMQTAFESTGSRPMEVAATLRARPLDRFLSVGLPLARRGYVTAATLAFAHTIGEFGVVLMIGGNIRGRTEVLSIAIYNAVERLDYGQAHLMAAGMLIFAFAILAFVFLLNRRWHLR